MQKQEKTETANVAKKVLTKPAKSSITAVKAATSRSNLGITVKKAEDMPEWYTQVILKAELADFAPIKGCMVIRPRGYAIWQNIMNYFNGRLKLLDVQNASFPLFIPESFFEREKQHAAGFEPEVAWIMKKDEESGERYALRPTSETIIYDSYARWVRSWRDLPLRINQWCNIVRWEVQDCKLFLRSREFLWQEGHCVYETKEDCDKEVLLYLEEYRKLAEEQLAIPVLLGQKTEKEKFAGALYTTTIEAFMPDGKALQLGTSHNLGQGFAKAFDISFIGHDEEKHLPWQNSWGFSTRLIGAVVMTHADDKGLILPPRIAPLKAVIVPILFEDTKAVVLRQAHLLKEQLEDEYFSVMVDDRDEVTPGWKFNEWELKGIPFRIEIGPKDLAQEHVVVVRRDTGKKEIVTFNELKTRLSELIDAMQTDLYQKAKQAFDQSIVATENWDDFVTCTNTKKMAKAFFCGSVDCEEDIKTTTKGVTSRCIPLHDSVPQGKKCIRCGKPAKHTVYFARNY
ncbi:proline--tRNA ligase [Candidatus Woesearchaeota archaeon]|nr:proline--tRNA ligase [Candidatus Woesearchaeota archaeon]